MPLLQGLVVTCHQTHIQNPLTMIRLQNNQPAYKAHLSAPTMALQKISPSKNNITLLDPRNSNRKYHQAKTTLPCWIPETVIPPESPLTLTPKTANPGLTPVMIRTPLISSGNSVGQAIKTLSPCISWQPSQSQLLETA